MNRRAIWTLGMTLLASLPAMSLSGCAARNTEADIRYDDGYRFTSEPRMRRIADTDVYYIRDASDYDLYQFEGTWYLNDNGSWYRAGTWRGPFVTIEADVIPYEISTVPSTYRKNWVAVRADRRDRRYRDLPEGYAASGRTFSTKPSMSRIPGSAVKYASRAGDYSLYRLRGTWYLVDDGIWYRSTSWRGPFLTIRAASVPRDILTLPARYRSDWSSSASYDRDDDRGWNRDRRTVRYWSSGRTLTMQPRTYVIPRTDVDYYRSDDNYDIYRYGSTWYLVDNGGWYRADSWRGPFISIESGSVPRAILSVPLNYRRYWTSD